MPSFVEVAKEEIDLSFSIVRQHSQAGENDFLPIDKMFPHTTQDVLFMIFTKAARAVGYQIAGRDQKVEDEVRDIINYCGFFLAFVYPTRWS